MNIGSMISKTDAGALYKKFEGISAPRPERKKHKTVVYNGKHLPSRRKVELPFILAVVREAGCDTVCFEDSAGIAIRGLVIAHWSKAELAMIKSAIMANEYMYKKTWRNTWAVVITC